MAAGGSARMVNGIWTVSPRLSLRLPRKRRKRKRRVRVRVRVKVKVRRRKRRNKSTSLGHPHVCYDDFSLVLSLQKLYHRIARCDFILDVFPKTRASKVTYGRGWVRRRS
jgi:hypothetical protein